MLNIDIFRHYQDNRLHSINKKTYNIHIQLPNIYIYIYKYIYLDREDVKTSDATNRTSVTKLVFPHSNSTCNTRVFFLVFKVIVATGKMLNAILGMKWRSEQNDTWILPRFSIGMVCIMSYMKNKFKIWLFYIYVDWRNTTHNLPIDRHIMVVFPQAAVPWVFYAYFCLECVNTVTYILQ